MTSTNLLNRLERLVSDALKTAHMSLSLNNTNTGVRP
jgi:hypothetical protein